MTADSSTVTTITHSGEDGGSPSGRNSLPSPWAQVVRGGNDPDSISSSPAPEISERNPDPVTMVEALAPEIQPECSDSSNNSNAGVLRKSAWNMPSANGAVEGTTTPVMGADSWPALSESTRSGVRSLSTSSDSSSRPASDGSFAVSQEPVVSQPSLNQVNTNITSNSHSNIHPVQNRPMGRRGSSSYNRMHPPPPPPLPVYGNLLPVVLETPVTEQPSFRGNTWSPRSVGSVGSHPHPVQDHSSNRHHARRNNFGHRPRGDGVGPYLNNGYGGRRERDHRGPRNPATRGVHIPHQMVPPPLPPVMGFIRPPPYPVPAPLMPPPYPLRPYGTPMGYEMASSYVYGSVAPPEPYRSAPLHPNAASQLPLHVSILEQIEFYFSEANLVKDYYLRSKMDKEGWVPITLIAEFRRVQKLTNDIQLILNSLRDSSIIEIQGNKIRRRSDWRRWIQPFNSFQSDLSSQSPSEARENTIEEASIQKLTLEDVSNTDNNIENVKKEVGTQDASKLANGEICVEGSC